jgi:pyruvate/2-oxoglutarate dehydrogenase complex dihydrolipoamide dehydrogenase (E3) component
VAYGTIRAASCPRGGRRIGGGCPNIACMPSKNEIWRAMLTNYATEVAKTTIDFPVVEPRKAA